MTSKEALQIIRYCYDEEAYETYYDGAKNVYEEELNIIEKDLEILEIIKKHKLLNYVLKNEKCANMYHLSKEECDLLREIENE